MKIEELTKRLKELVTDTDNKKKHKLYADCCCHAEDMEVHIYGEKPEKLLKRVRPHEDPAITHYRLESYEPTTMSTAEKALTIVNKIFHQSNYSINFESDSKSQLLKEYTIEEYPVFNSIVSYLSQYALKKNIADPNGIFCVQPYNYAIKPTDYVQPFLTAYSSEDVWDMAPDYVIIFLDKQETPRERKWFFQVIDTISIINCFLSTTNGTDYYFQELNRYDHQFNELPVWSLGGVYDQEKPGLFESFFYAAVPFWNKAINAESDLDGAYVKHMNPQKWETADECEYVHKSDSGVTFPCINGHIFDSDSGHKMTCPSCGGHGRKSLTGPYDVAWVNQSKFQGGDNATGIPIPPFGYVTVPTEATAMLEKRVDALLEKGLNALNMDVVNKIGENQSGVAKVIDRTELNDFLGKIRDRFFDTHLKNFYYFAAKYMFGVTQSETTEIEPDIIKPQNFDIYSTVELTEQLKVAKDAGLSPSYLQTKQSEIQNKEFAQDPDLLAELTLMSKLDPLSEETRDDILAMQSGGSVTKQNVIIHDNIREFITRAMIEVGNFADLGYLEQRKVLLKYAEEVVTANKVMLPDVPMVDAQGNTINQNNTQNG